MNFIELNACDILIRSFDRPLLKTALYIYKEVYILYKEVYILEKFDRERNSW